jgi:hypothetical protein
MNKCDDKFCPDCGHHLYGPELIGYWCQECPCWVEIEDAATYAEVLELRKAYDPAARAEVEE